MSASSAVFERLSEEIEAATPLSRLEARGTVRLALKEAGLEARTVTADQMKVVLQGILPDQLRARGVAIPDLCERLGRAIEAASSNSAEATSPDAIFRHLGGDC